MARASSRRIEKLVCFLIVLFTNAVHSSFVPKDDFAPEFSSIQQQSVAGDEDYKRVRFQVRGRNIQNGLQIKATKRESERDVECEDLDVNYNVSEISTSEFRTGLYELTVPKSVQGNVYLCLPRRIKEDSAGVPPNVLHSEFVKWYHQGPNVTLNLTSDFDEKNGYPSVHRRDAAVDGAAAEPDLRVMGIRLEAAASDPDFEDGVPLLLADKQHTVRLFGKNFNPNMIVTFTKDAAPFGRHCDMITHKGFPIEEGSFLNHTVVVKITLPLHPAEEPFYLCVKHNESALLFYHQGEDYWLQIKTFEKMIPVWASICIIVICLSFSSLFSGLNLGLMSMDKTELKILCNTGTPRERSYAQVIQPVRATGNYLLCSILLGNVFVNSIFTILLDDLTSGTIAVIFSTLAIVMFGEITPQAVCSRHGLAIGAKTIWITKFVMMLTFPLSYPIAKFLDFVLGEEIGNVYTRERLKELVRVTTGENDLDKDEVNIISGALELRKKTVSEVMTKIEDVFMLDYEAILDFETVSEIMKSGYSRIPVFEGNRQNIVTVLYIKDLAFVDPDDNTPLKTLCQFYQNPCNFVFEDVTLDVMFKIFKEGNKGHMAFVHRVNNEGEGDPFYETIGLITLEDVIEELIQAEIMDETDVFTDNRNKRRRTAERRQDFSMFAEKRGEPCKVRISPQLTLAAFQYLSTSVEPFHPNVISETILRRLLKQDIVVHIKKNKEWRTDPGNVIYNQGKAVDFFVIILEGRVEVTVGKENLVFEGGPFTYFGTQALVQTVGIESPSVAPSTIGSLESLNIDSILRHTFIPDYTVRACTEVLYLKVKRSLYLAAKRATLMEKSKKGEEHQSEQQFDEEVDKLLHSLEEDDVSAGGHTPGRKSSRTKSQEVSWKEGVSSQTSPKTPSHQYSSASPPHRLSARDVNGSIKSSPVDDVVHHQDEEVSLLPKRS